MCRTKKGKKNHIIFDVVCNPEESEADAVSAAVVPDPSGVPATACFEKNPNDAKTRDVRPAIINIVIVIYTPAHCRPLLAEPLFLYPLLQQKKVQALGCG